MHQVKWQEMEGDAIVWRFGKTEFRYAGDYVAVDRVGEDDVVFVQKDAIFLVAMPVYPQDEKHAQLKEELGKPNPSVVVGSYRYG